MTIKAVGRMGCLAFTCAALAGVLPGAALSREPAMGTVSAGCVETGSGAARARTCVTDFEMGRHETTRGEFGEFVAATGYRTDAERGAGGIRGCATEELGQWRYHAARSWKDPGFAQDDDHPVVCVSWHDASRYAAWLSEQSGERYRLPTEVEWERAAGVSVRGKGGRVSGACRLGNVRDRSARLLERPEEHFDCDDRAEHTASVGRYEANTFGLHDMFGNVWEWTCSAFSTQNANASARCAPASETTARSIRGASWFDPPFRASLFARAPVTMAQRNSALGFRLVKDRGAAPAAGSGTAATPPPR